MTASEQLIQIYNVGFYICLTITVLSILAAVFIFFKMQILVQLGIQSGKTEKKTVKRMSEQNAQTGTLRQIVEVERTTDSLSDGAEQTSLLNDPAATTPLEEKTPTTGKMGMFAIPQDKHSGFKFVITENVMVIHTEERI